MEKIRSFVSAHKTIVLIAALIFLGILGYSGFQKISSQQSGSIEEVGLAFDAEGPYAILYPRRDGNALVLNIKRIASFDAFSYQISYLDATGIDRGAGDLNTWIELKDQGEYEQEILFGTCSQGHTSDPKHCVFDKGVENGTLILRIRKENKAYRMLSQWHLQKPDLALGVLTSGDGHLSYKVEADRTTLSNVAFSIVNDLTGVPKLPSGKVVSGKVYSLNVPITKVLPAGDVTLELGENPGSDAKLYRHDGSKWQELDTKVDGSRLSGQSSGSGIVAVLIPKK